MRAKEAALLGLMMIDNSIIKDVVQVISDDYVWSDPAFQELWVTITAIHTYGGTADAESVKVVLDTMQKQFKYTFLRVEHIAMSLEAAPNNMDWVDLVVKMRRNTKIKLSADQYKLARQLANNGLDYFRVAHLLNVDHFALALEWGDCIWTKEQLDAMTRNDVHKIIEAIKKENGEKEVNDALDSR